MTHASLFSGIGGFDLAASWLGWPTILQVEIDPWCRTILERHFPDAHRHADIRTLDTAPWKGAVDIVSGGFPCQPFSNAGKRRGQDDDRYLWPEMLRVITEIGPRWVVAENVSGIYSQDNGLVFERVCADLENAGYEIQPIRIPAAGVGAWHRRDRWWFVAHAMRDRGKPEQIPWQQQRSVDVDRDGTEWTLADARGVRCDSSGLSLGAQTSQSVSRFCGVNVSDTNRHNGEGLQSRSIDTKRRSFASQRPSGPQDTGRNWWTIEPGVGRMAHGVPNRVDRLRALGNAIVPQVAYELFLAIQGVENQGMLEMNGQEN